MPAQAAIALLLMVFLVITETVRAEANPQPELDARTAEKAKESEPLEKGKPVEKALAAGEVHAYALKLGADQSVTVLLDKHGVAAVATLIAPNGEKVGTFGSTASNQGTEQINFVTESAGSYRITVRTFFKPSPPGRYMINLAEVHAASNQEKNGRARQHCEEKNWLDRENNFLVNEALGSISRCVSAVGHKLEASYPKANELAAEANAEVSYLIGRWHWGEFVSAAYQENLVGDFRMLASAAEEPDAERSFAIMKGIVEDLKIKADHCRNSNRGLGDDIDVFVRTWTKGKTSEIKGLVVYYKLGISAFNKGTLPPDRFDKLSSPTRQKLPASRYLIWVGQPGQSAPPLDMMNMLKVGEGKKMIDFDLLVP
jgi:hypothetical protein